MRKKLIIDSWNGGMGSDPSIGVSGAFYDGRGIEVRKDARKVKLSNNYSSDDVVLNSRANGWAVGAIIEGSPYQLYATRDGKLANAFFGESYGTYYTDSTYVTFYNMFRYYGPNDYGVIIAANGVLRWVIDINSFYLGIVANNIVTNADFSAGTGWTVGAGWAIGGGSAVHTPGNTATLEQTLTVDNATKYIINVRMDSLFAGSFTVSMGGSVLGTVSTSETYTFTRTTASTSEDIVLTPTSSFNGSINSVYVQRSTVELAVSDSFIGDIVTLQTPNALYIGNTDTLTKIDTTTSSWTSSDPVKVAAGYTIKGLSKIGDQIIIYASNGSTGKQYIWDGESPLPSREITWYDKPISRVLNLNNIDYITTKTLVRSSLYMVNGYQPELIAQSGNISNNELDRFAFEGNSYINGIETIGNKLLIPTAGGLYSYGIINPGFPNSLIKEYTWNGGEPRTTYYSESSGYERLYVFYSSTKSGSFKNYYRSLYQYDEQTTVDRYSVYDPGYIRTYPFLGSSYSQRKSSVGYKIGANIPTGTFVNIYSKIDDETGYATFYTDSDTNPITVLPTVGAVYTNGGNTYTVTSVIQTKAVTYGGAAIINCTYTGTTAVGYSGTLAKSSGTGDSSIKFYRSNTFKLIQSLVNIGKGGQRFQYTESYNKIEWIVELGTTDSKLSPSLYDFQYIFDEVETDS